MRHPVRLGIAALVALLAGCFDASRVFEPGDEGARAKPAAPDGWNWSDIRIASGAPGPCDPVDPEEGPSASQGTGTLADPCDEPSVTFTCTNAVTRGGNATCTISASPSGVAFQVSQWRFSGSGYSIDGPTSVESWSGQMVVSGTITVQYVLQGQPGISSAHISVNPRAWSWSAIVGGRQGNPGEIDHCMIPSQAGLMSGQSCSPADPNALLTPATFSPGSGFLGSRVPDGPNTGLWYVQSASATMQLRTQIHRLFRSDGPLFSLNGDPQIVGACTSKFGSAPQNTYGVNTACQSVADFANFVTFVWQHEGRHLNAGINAGRSSANDLHRLWEPLVAQQQSQLETLARDVFNTTRSRIRDAALSTHTGATFTFSFWRYTSGWAWAHTTVFD